MQILARAPCAEVMIINSSKRRLAPSFWAISKLLPVEKDRDVPLDRNQSSRVFISH